ncbi:MAG: phosphatidate cytidylyltransferase, partial [Acidimicrobiales bacterium]
MGDGYTDDHTEALDLSGPGGDDGSDVPGAGARRGPREAAEGVRIIGAEEAAAAIEAGQVAGRRPEDAPRFGDVPEPPSGPRPSLRFPGADPTAVEKPQVAEPPPSPPPPLQGDASPLYAQPASYADPTMVSGSDDDRGFSDIEEHQFWDEPRQAADPEAGPEFGTVGGGEGTGSNALPHWTEPPSGEVPRILPETDDAETDDDLRAWSSLSTGPRWRDQHTDWDETDFNDEILEDPELRVGALRSAAAQAEDDLDVPYDDPEPVAAPPPAPRQIRRAPSLSRRADPSGSSGHGGGDATPPRDVTTSVITGVGALAVVLVAAFIGPKALIVLVIAALVMAAAELYGAMRVAGHHPATLLGVVGTGALSAAVYWRGVDGFNLVMPLFMVFALLWYLTGVVKGRPLMNVAVTVLGFFYVGILGSFAALLLKAPSNHGIGLLLGAVLTTAAYDAGAFFAGRSIGRTPLAPEISPGKTVEGMAGACFATLVAGL